MERSLTIQDVLDLDTFEDHHGSCFVFSPDGSLLAFTVQRAVAKGIRHVRPFLAGNDRGELFLADVASGEVRPLAADAEQGRGFFAPAWSPDGTVVAVSVVDAHSVRIAIIDVASGDRQVPTTRNLALPGGIRPYVWTGDGELLCAVLPENTVPLALDAEFRGPARAQAAWARAWAGQEPTASVLDALSNTPNPLDGVLEPAPEFLVFSRRDGSMRHLRDDETTAEIDAFKRQFDRRPPGEIAPPAEDERPDWVRALRPPEDGRLVAAHQGTRQVAFLIEDDQGSRVVIARGQERSRTAVFQTNTHLRQVNPGRVRDLEYQRPDGERSIARLLLPPGQKEGERRPAVVWVYPGASPGPRARPFFKANHASPFNLQLLAAQGHVVVEPSLPLPDTSEPLDILPMLAQGVVPAVDAAVKAGYVDPERVHVMGQSMGGWATMSLLATTDVFRSGIALAGIYNLISFHGSCDPRFRYDDSDLHAFKLAEMCERSWRLGGPPWQDPGRYVRNSPLFLAERITAPVMIVQGDQDYATISQGEEMFSALRQLGKPVRFVRYWGEGHVLSSPANIADLWKRIFAWLDEQHSRDRTR